MAVNEKTGEMIQVSEGGYTGMLCIAQKSMKLYFMRNAEGQPPQNPSERNSNRSLQIIEVDLDKLFADSKAGTLKPASAYQRICGTTPVEMGAGGDMALDGGEEWVYFRVGKTEAAKYLAAGTKIAEPFGPRNMGAGPAGLARMNIKTGELKHIVSVPFQVGHIQSNPWNPNEIVFCWETGGKSPQRTWTVMADGTGLRPLYPEADYEWVTHEAVISRDEVALAILGHRKIKFEKKSPGDTTKETSDPQNPGQENA
jgi:oligogalacturonide lyase